MKNRGPKGIEAGDVIGYHPLGNEEVRQTGIVKGWNGTEFVVTMEDDPGIEEKVRPEDVRSHKEAADG